MLPVASPVASPVESIVSGGSGIRNHAAKPMAIARVHRSGVTQRGMELSSRQWIGGRDRVVASSGLSGDETDKESHGSFCFAIEGERNDSSASVSQHDGRLAWRHGERHPVAAVGFGWEVRITLDGDLEELGFGGGDLNLAIAFDVFDQHRDFQRLQGPNYSLTYAWQLPDASLCS